MAYLTLDEVHHSLGAERIEIDGTPVPAHYGDPMAEYRAARTGTGICSYSAARIEYPGPCAWLMNSNIASSSPRDSHLQASSSCGPSCLFQCLRWQ